MTNREIFFAIKEKKEQYILSWIMSFFNYQVAIKLLGKENVPMDSCDKPLEWSFGASERQDWDRKIKYANATGNFAIAVGKGACIPFGHGGPGEFLDRQIEWGENYRITEYETGVKSETRYKPHFYHNYDHPVKSSDFLLENLKIPDPDNTERYKLIAEEAEYYKQHGFVASASINGFFSGLHYFLYPYDSLLSDLLLEPLFIEKMLDKLGCFNLKAAEHLLKSGVDMISLCDDLGSGSAMLISPELYRRFFLPWHKRLAELCHKYNACVHLHSHGNINSIVQDLYEAGIDILNPNDPYEGMNLIELKAKYGDNMIFCGGLDKFFFDWDYQKQRGYVRELAEKAQGGFILMDSGGVPENINMEDFRKIKELFDEVKAGAL